MSQSRMGTCIDSLISLPIPVSHVQNVHRKSNSCVSREQTSYGIAASYSSPPHFGGAGLQPRPRPGFSSSHNRLLYFHSSCGAVIASIDHRREVTIAVVIGWRGPARSGSKRGLEIRPHRCQLISSPSFKTRGIESLPYVDHRDVCIMVPFIKQVGELSIHRGTLASRFGPFSRDGMSQEVRAEKKAMTGFSSI
jgi:hypothetical protein